MVTINKKEKGETMVTNEFAESAAEIIEIFKYLPKEEVEKIPIELREFLNNIKKQDYKVNIDTSKPLEKQELKQKTKELLTVIYRKYWCTEEQRKILDKILIENDKIYEQQLREKYNPDKLFKKDETKN